MRFEKLLNGHGIGLHDGNDFLWMTDLGYPFNGRFPCVSKVFHGVSIKK